MNRRPKKTCLKGKRVNSSCYLTRIGAETELFQFRYSKESPESRILIENKVRELKGGQHITPSSVDVNSDNDYDISDISRSNDTTPASSDTSSSRTKGVYFPPQHYDVFRLE